MISLYPSLSTSTNMAAHTSFSVDPTEIQDAAALSRFVATHHHTAALFQDGYRKGENWAGADCLILDVDSGRTLEEFQKDFVGVSYLAATSKSHQKEKVSGRSVLPPADRFHVYFPLSTRYTRETSAAYSRIAGTVLKLFPYFDPAVKDLARMFCPSGEGVLVREGSGEFIDQWVERLQKQDLLSKLCGKAEEGRFDTYADWLRLGSGLKTEGYSWEDWAELSWPGSRQACQSKWDGLTRGKATGASLHYFLMPSETAASTEKSPEATDAKDRLMSERWFASTAEALDWFDRRYFRVNLGGKPSVVEKSGGVEGAIRLADFYTSHLNKKLAEGSQVREAARVWAERTNQSFKEVIFDPSPKATPDPDVYNLWQGFRYRPRTTGKSASWLEFVRDTVCCGDETLFDYLMDVLAKIIQEPHEKSKGGNIAVALRGSQGVGKGFFVESFAHLFPQSCFLEAKSVDEITGKFNIKLINKIVVFSDEAVFGGDKAAKNILKNLITSSYLLIEGKYANSFESRNYLRFFFATNNRWAAPVETNDRRYLVLDVSSKHQRDNEYFKRLEDDLDAGGYEDLLAVLLDRDYSNRDFESELPMTAAKQESMDRMRSPLETWYHEILSGYGSGPEEHWFGEGVPTARVYESYLNWTKSQGKHAESLVSFVKDFQALSGIKKYRPRDGGGTRKTVFVFEDIETLQKKFEESLGRVEAWEE